ncbi:hypothetical protein CO608_09885 [Lysobacteraceae bacterium NML08-0793]|nr:hypothetical protein CO608_09885 [Xanthomonadaceae bacterium NML08-0793]
MTPEVQARQRIDRKLHEAGWAVQDMRALNLSAARGVAVREYPTDTDPADYVLFVDRQPVGVIEAKKDSAGANLIVAETQTARYANATLKWRKDNTPLRFLFEATGQIIHFTDGADPAPRSREVFHFFRPETLAEWLAQPQTLRRRLTQPPLLLTTEKLWSSYARVKSHQVKGVSSQRQLTDLIALLRFALGLDAELKPFADEVDKRFQSWVFRHNAQRRTAFTDEQMTWLRLMKNHIASSCSICRDDFDYAELADHGGLQKAWQLFGKELDGLMDEMNWEMVA